MKINTPAVIGIPLGIMMATQFAGPFMNTAQCVVPSNNKPAVCDTSQAASSTVAKSSSNSAIPRISTTKSTTKAGPNKWPVGTLKYYMVNVGFKGRQLDDMAAILIGESGISKTKINARAHNCNTRTKDDSYGLGQINLLGDLIMRLNTYNLKNAEALYEPTRNLQITYELAQSKTGYKHWGSYNQGTYLRFYGRNPQVVSVPNNKCSNA